MGVLRHVKKNIGPKKTLPNALEEKQQTNLEIPVSVTQSTIQSKTELQMD